MIGDVRDIADGVKQGKQRNQQASQWNHGQVRAYITYKAAAEGIAVALIDEHYTTQTCPHCGKQHKLRGRVYSCGQCGFSTRRDVVGQINILSRYKTGQVGLLPAPATIKHRMPHNLRLMRRRRDTGQQGKAKSRKLKSENETFQLSALSSQFSPTVARGTDRQPREAAGF